MPLQFQRDKYVKVFDVQGNYHFGYIARVADRGFTLEISLDEEGLSKINYEAQHIACTGGYTYNFDELLTDIEKRLVSLLACGLTTKEIGDEMDISPVTVRAHMRDMKHKLQLQTRDQLVVYSQGIARILENGHDMVESMKARNAADTPANEVERVLKGKWPQ